MLVALPRSVIHNNVMTCGFLSSTLQIGQGEGMGHSHPWKNHKPRRSWESMEGLAHLQEGSAPYHSILPDPGRKIIG